MKTKGLLSIEVLIAFAVFIIIIVSMPTPKNHLNQTILSNQKINDLLIIWTREKTNESEMIKDADFFLGKNSYSLNINQTANSNELFVFENVSGEIISRKPLIDTKIKISLRKNN